MTSVSDCFVHSSPTLDLEARGISWDSELLGCPVAEIISMRADGLAESQNEFDRFQDWLQENGYGMVSCRLPHQKLIESALLEKNRFRFVEMVLHPELGNLQKIDVNAHGIEIGLAGPEDVPAIAVIAETAFEFERFHIDPFLNVEIANARYKRWVESSAGSKTQILLKARLNGRIIGFFLVEYENRQVYWHLTAITPELKGRGLGVRVWKAMMRQHQKDGMHSILTTISARNVPVLNLYSKLNFRFQPPEMTFHWVNQKLWS